MNIRSWIIALGLAISGMAAEAAAQTIGGDIDLRGDQLRGDIMVIAGDLDISGEVDGDVIALAGDARIDALVRGDVQVAGGEIEILGAVEGEIDAAGGQIEVRASAGEDVELNGGEVRFYGRSAGKVEIRAGHAVFARGAEAGGELEIDGGQVEINGVVRGNVEVRAGEVRFGPEARIDGAVRVVAEREPIIMEGAQIAGQVDYEYREFRVYGLDWDFVDFDMEYMDIVLPVRLFGGAFIGLAIFIGLGAILLAPRGTARVAAGFRRRPFLATLMGFILFAMSPIILTLLTVLLTVTVIGIPVVVLMWMLLMPFFLLMLAFGAVAIGDVLLNRSGGTLSLGMRTLSFLLVMIALIAIGAVPGVGLLAGFFLVFAGLGAWIFSFHRDDRGAAGSGPTAGEQAAGPAPATE